MIEYFKQLFSKQAPTNQYYNIRIDWVEKEKYEQLKEILKSYPGSALSKESKDDKGNFLGSGTRGILFPDESSRQNFLTKYAHTFNAIEVNEYLPTKLKVHTPQK